MGGRAPPPNLPGARGVWCALIHRSVAMGRCYNRAVSGGGGRRVGIVILTLLFAVALILAHAPLDLGSVRVAGVSVLWWYTFAMAPALAVLTTVVLLPRGKG
jgi:hypothetical protein